MIMRWGHSKESTRLWIWDIPLKNVLNHIVKSAERFADTLWPIMTCTYVWKLCSFTRTLSSFTQCEIAFVAQIVGKARTLKQTVINRSHAYSLPIMIEEIKLRFWYVLGTFIFIHGMPEFFSSWNYVYYSWHLILCLSVSWLVI